MSRVDIGLTRGRGLSGPGARIAERVGTLRNFGLQPLVIATAGAYILIFVVSGALRATYDFPLDANESGALVEVRRVLAGQPVYAAPTLAYVPFVYGPIYFYAAALTSVFVGASFTALRLTSLLGSLGSLLLVALIVRRETNSLTFAVLAAGLLAGCARLVNGAMDSGRTDAVSTCLALGAIYALQPAILRPSGQGRNLVWGGCLIGLAVLTKQTNSVLAVAMAIGIGLTSRRLLAAYVVSVLATLALGLLLLTLQSGSWPLFYLWELPRHHSITPELLPRLWDDVLARYTLPLLFGVGYLADRARARDKRRFILYGAFALGLVGAAWGSRANSGGAPNVDLPAFAGLSVLFALAVHQVSIRTPRASGVSLAYGLWLAIAQLLVLINNPRDLVPYRADVWASERLRSTLTAQPGPVFAPSFAGYTDAPDAVAPDIGALLELMGAYGGRITPQGSQWLDQYGTALAAKRFTTVVVDPDFPALFVRDVASDNGYVAAGPLFPSQDEFWRWRSVRTPRAELYVPAVR